MTGDGRRSRIVLAVAIAVGVLVCIAGYRAATGSAKYAASTDFFVGVGDGAVASEDAVFQGTNTGSLNTSVYALNRVRTYVQLATSDQVLERVLAKAPAYGSIEHLRRNVAASTIEGTLVVRISVQGDTAGQADAAAAELAPAFSDVVQQLELPASGSGATPIRLVEIRRPQPAGRVTPISALLGTWVVAGTAAGLVTYLIGRRLVRRPGPPGSRTGDHGAADSPASVGGLDS